MKLIVLAAMLCALAASGAAQGSTGERQGAKPDLSGTWVMDKAGSNAEAVRRYGERGLTLVVSHRDPELRVTRKTAPGGGSVCTKPSTTRTGGAKGRAGRATGSRPIPRPVGRALNSGAGTTST